MAEAVAAKWVAIRLAQRYPNGSMVSYSARAIAHDEISVCVLVTEEFETGTQLSVMAPFLDGLMTARVFSVTRSRTQPGHFEVFLQIGERSASTVLPTANRQNRVSGKRKSGSENGSKGRREVAAQPDASKPATLVPELALEAASKLADELGKLPARRLSEVLDEIPAEVRSMALLVAVAAAIHLLQQKGHVEARRLIRSMTDNAAEGAKEVVTQ
jgi:hypothetical protein